MNLERLLEGVKRIGEFKTFNSSIETRFSVLFNDDGSGSIYRTRGELPTEKLSDFESLEKLEGIVKNQLDNEAPFKLGQLVKVAVSQPSSTDDNSPPLDTVGTVVKVRTSRTMIMWFGDDEDPKYWWIYNEDLATV